MTTSPLPSKSWHSEFRTVVQGLVFYCIFYCICAFVPRLRVYLDSLLNINSWVFSTFRYFYCIFYCICTFAPMLKVCLEFLLGPNSWKFPSIPWGPAPPPKKKKSVKTHFIQLVFLPLNSVYWSLSANLLGRPRGVLSDFEGGPLADCPAMSFVFVSWQIQKYK